MAGEKKRQGRRAHLNDFYRDVAGLSLIHI